MKYIDIDLLLKEIEKKSREEQGFSSEDSEYGYHSCAKDLLAFIDSLQQEQPEVDLEKLALEKYPIQMAYLEGLKKGYELGLKARKEE